MGPLADRGSIGLSERLFETMVTDRGSVRQARAVTGRSGSGVLGGERPGGAGAARARPRGAESGAEGAAR